MAAGAGKCRDGSMQGRQDIPYKSRTRTALPKHVRGASSITWRQSKPGAGCGFISRAPAPQREPQASETRSFAITSSPRCISLKSPFLCFSQLAQGPVLARAAILALLPRPPPYLLPSRSCSPHPLTHRYRGGGRMGRLRQW